jgi:peptidoglycan-N-acetylglucosamine deacetylase
MCGITNTSPSLLLHPLDFMGAEDDRDLWFFPGMRMGWSRKHQLLDGFFDVLLRQFGAMTVGEHVAAPGREPGLQSFAPRFSHTS